jgi:hypothetical protein
LAIIVSKWPSEAQALRAALLVVSLLYPYEINKPVHNGLLSILDRLLKNGRRYVSRQLQAVDYNVDSTVVSKSVANP